MGKILRTKKLTTLSELLIVVLGIGGILTTVYYLSPGLRTGEAKQLNGMTLDGQQIDNNQAADKMALPGTAISSKVSSKPTVRIAGYAWNAQSGIIAANGGPKTTEGSLMEQNGVKLEIIRQDWLTELRTMQLKFIQEYNKGIKHPTSNKSAFAVMIMGDGAPFYISSTQKTIDET
jgi:OmpA-OmpF porin, OOP family